MGGIIDDVFGKGGDDYKEPESSKMAAWIAKDMYEKTGGIRNQTFADLGNQNWDVGQSPMWAGGKNVIESQYDTAKENMMSNIPAGGALYEGLGNVERARAGGFTDLVSQIMTDRENKQYGIATGVPQQTVSGLLGSANQQANAMSLNAQSDASKNQLMGDAAKAAALFFS